MNKKPSVKILAFTALLAGAMMLSACSNGDNNNAVERFQFRAAKQRNATGGFDEYRE